MTEITRKIHPAAHNSDAYSVDEFCRRHDISRSAFYQLRRDGDGPRAFKVGRRTLISIEAAAEWRRAMEGRAT